MWANDNLQQNDPFWILANLPEFHVVVCGNDYMDGWITIALCDPTGATKTEIHKISGHNRLG